MRRAHITLQSSPRQAAPSDLSQPRPTDANSKLERNWLKCPGGTASAGWLRSVNCWSPDNGRGLGSSLSVDFSDPSRSVTGCGHWADALMVMEGSRLLCTRGSSFECYMWVDCSRSGPHSYFQGVKSVLEYHCAQCGFGVLFLSKFHPELNPVGGARPRTDGRLP